MSKILLRFFLLPAVILLLCVAQSAASKLWEKEIHADYTI